MENGSPFTICSLFFILEKWSKLRPGLDLMKNHCYKTNYIFIPFYLEKDYYTPDEDGTENTAEGSNTIPEAEQEIAQGSEEYYDATQSPKVE